MLEQPYLIPTLLIGGALENARLKINIASNLLASFSTDTHLLIMGFKTETEKSPKECQKINLKTDKFVFILLVIRELTISVF